MTEHLPIQRYEADWMDECHIFAYDGDCVRYADHVAAMIAEGGAAKNYGYEQGQRDALAGAVQRVEALPDLVDAGFTYSDLLHRAYVIAAIKGDHA